MEKFEIWFTVYFSGKGLEGKAFTDRSHINIEYGKNPYLCYFHELIKYDKFPILERKTVCLEHLDELKQLVDYIECNSNYDISLMCSHIKRLYEEKRIVPIHPFNPDTLERFCKDHDRIFIYGQGAYGKGIARYLKYKNWRYVRFIITENRNNEEKVFIYKDMSFGLRDGIILGLGESAFREVYPIIKKN